MSSVSEWVVREYFEALGYLVSEPYKYLAPGRRKSLEEAIDLLVYHPQVQEVRMPDQVVWNGADLRGVQAGIVAVYGWHTDRFYPPMLERILEMSRFASEESVRQAARRLGTRQVAKILCLPQLPASRKLRENTLALIKKKGIDGVLLFRTMLLELVDHVDTNRNYERSDLLQMLRLMKNYDLVKDKQMDFFQRRRRAKTAHGSAAPKQEEPGAKEG